MQRWSTACGTSRVSGLPTARPAAGIVVMLGSWLLAGCSSVAWSEPVSAATWRQATLREAEHASVVARDERDAAEVYQEYEHLVDAMRTAGIELPPRPLLIAVAARDELLCGDGMATLTAMARWQGSGKPTMGKDETDTPPEAFDLMARGLAVRPPIDAPELALPDEWQQRFRWAFVMPSESCLDTVAAQMFDVMMAKEQIGFAKRLLMAPFLPMARSMMVGELSKQNRTALLAAAVADREPLPADALARCRKALGLPDAVGEQAGSGDVATIREPR